MMMYLIILTLTAAASLVAGQNVTLVTLKSSVNEVKIGVPFTITCEAQGQPAIPFRMELLFSDRRAGPSFGNVGAFLVRKEGVKEFIHENGWNNKFELIKGADNGYNFVITTHSEQAGIYKCELYAANKDTSRGQVFGTSDPWAARYLKYDGPSRPDPIPAVTVTKTMNEASTGNGDIAWQCTVDVKPQDHFYDFSVSYYVDKTKLGMYITKQDIHSAVFKTVKNENELDDMNQIYIYPTEIRTYPIFEILMRQNLHDLDYMRENSRCVVELIVDRDMESDVRATYRSGATQLASSIGSIVIAVIVSVGALINLSHF